MTYPPSIRERARELRVTKKLSIDEIAERLALPKTTIYYWTLDLPLGRPRRENGHVGNLAMQEKYRRLREDAYAQGLAEYDDLVPRPKFRDLVALYIAEGSKRNRNRVCICNSDERIVAMATGWLRALSDKEPTYSIQYHADQDLAELRHFWGNLLGIDGSSIRMQRKSNSGRLGGRSWRSEHGVLAVWVADTQLRARLQAWMDRIRDDWRLDSAAVSGA
jgi:hypothetical protein